MYPIPHYNLRILLPTGQTKLTYELRAFDDEERKLPATTVQHVFDIVADYGVVSPFALFWRGEKLENPNVLLRDVEVQGHKLDLYVHDPKFPLVVIKE